MPAGTPYFAWIDPGETIFGPEHLRWDEDIFSFQLAQSEGDPASLTLVVRRPRNEAGERIGLLGPSRKIWCWFALDCGLDLFEFRGRLVGVPTSMFEELVTLEFVARPVDLVAQKAALAETLRVLPYYDEVVIDPARRTDPEVVLEGYTAIWHYDRETHVVSISDEILGEDGTISLDMSEDISTVFYEGLSLNLTSGPLSRVDIKAEYTWTQTAATGGIDLTNWITSQWPGGSPGVITSYTFAAGDWLKTGASLSAGWVVKEGTAVERSSNQVHTTTSGGTLKVIFPDDGWFGDSSTTTTWSDSVQYIANTNPTLFAGGIVLKDDINVKLSPVPMTEVV